MPLATVVAGPYTGAYNTSAIGKTEDGFRLQQRANKQIVRSDAYGDSAIDAVYRGGDVFLVWTGIEYASAIAAFWPYGNPGVMGQVGRLDVGSTIIKTMVLTAIAGTTAASTPASLTSTHCILDEQHNGELMYASRARFVPLTMRLYPYESSSSVVWFTMT